MKNKQKKQLKKRREIIKELLKKNLKNLSRIPNRGPASQSRTTA